MRFRWRPLDDRVGQTHESAYILTLSNKQKAMVNGVIGVRRQWEIISNDESASILSTRL
jgi:hypothetical protein